MILHKITYIRSGYNFPTRIEYSTFDKIHVQIACKINKSKIMWTLRTNSGKSSTKAETVIVEENVACICYPKIAVEH